MSSKWKDLAKNGWHPEKDGTSLRGQMVCSPESRKQIDNCFNSNFNIVPY